MGSKIIINGVTIEGDVSGGITIRNGVVTIGGKTVNTGASGEVRLIVEEVDMMFQVASRRIQGLTEKVNHWKRRANELEAALGVEKAARIVPPTHYDELQEELNKERSAHAESCRYLAESEAKAREWGTENKRLRAEVADLEKQRDGLPHVTLPA